jgi:hypothetical protein
VIIAAVIGVCIVVGAIVGAFVWYGTALRDAERRTADARVNDETKAGRIAILETDLATQTARADSEHRRADALDDELENVASDGDADGARGRVLSRWKRQREASATAAATGGGGSGAVPAQPAPAPAGSRVDRDGLEKP